MPAARHAAPCAPESEMSGRSLAPPRQEASDPTFTEYFAAEA